MKKRKAGKITGVKPTGTLVLIEMLTNEEALGTSLIVSDNAEVTNPQGYVVEIGPALKESNWGIKKGDRVVLQGSYVPIPKFSSGRDLGLVEIHTIKCVLEEE